MATNMKRFAAAGMALALTCAALADGKLTGLQMHKVGQGVEVQIQGSDLAKPRVSRLNGDRSYMLEFDASLVGSSKFVRVHYGGLQYVRAGWFKSRPPVVRVHFWMTKGQSPQLTQNGAGWLVGLNAGAHEETAAVATPAFPSKVPPLKSAKAEAKATATTTTATVVYSAKIGAAQAAKPAVRPPKLVRLNFENTEVVQILKGLAVQTGANIVTGPEVAGKINVQLDNVTLQDALDYVTTLAGVRYAKVGKTYIVTSNARFADAMQQIAGKLDLAGETRVVQLISGEGVQIKAATFKALPQFTAAGSYDIILPSEDIEAKSLSGTGTIQGSGSESTSAAQIKSGTGAAAQGAGAGAAAGGSGVDNQANSGNTGAKESTTSTTGNTSTVSLTAKSSKNDKAKVKDPYLLVVGSPERVNEVVGFIKGLDSDVARAECLGPNADVQTKVVPVYSGQLERICTALQSQIDREPRRAAFQLSNNQYGPTAPTGDDKGAPALELKDTPRTPLIFVSGPSDRLPDLVNLAQVIDQGICEASNIPYAKTASEAIRSYEVLVLNHVDPVQTLQMLNKQLPRLFVDLMPGQTGTTTAASTAASGTGSAGAGTATPPQGGGTQATSVSSTASGIPMRLLAYGTRQEIEVAQRLIATADVPTKQVALELRVLELSHEDALKLGLDWSILTGGTLKSIRVNQSVGGGSGLAGNITGSVRLPGTDTADVLATLDQITDKNKIISRPNVLANDGQQTKLFVGDTITYVESVNNGANTGLQVTTKSIDVGVTMDVTPRVGAGNMLTLGLHPSLTFLKGFTDVPGGGQIPQTSRRSVDFVTSIRSGETIAIGGLIQDQDKTTISGIPFLRDLPIIGQLFRRTSKDKTRSEVVFFLTAKVVDETDRATAGHPGSHDGDRMPEPNRPRNGRP